MALSNTIFLGQFIDFNYSSCGKIFKLLFLYIAVLWKNFKLVYAKNSFFAIQ
jgi:hypothetical protein